MSKYIIKQVEGTLEERWETWVFGTVIYSSSELHAKVNAIMLIKEYIESLLKDEETLRKELLSDIEKL